VCGPGVPLREIGESITAVAKKYNLTVSRDFIGHGVGKVFHAAPQVIHNRNNLPGTMQVGTDSGLFCKDMGALEYKRDY
jgi:methionyl aminopeptidase